MKKLTLKEIVITIVVSYLITAYIQAELNPINWEIGTRITQIALLLCSITIQTLIKQG